MVAQDFQPIRVHEILKSKSITNPAAGAYVFDLGQNMVGWARLHESGLVRDQKGCGHFLRRVRQGVLRESDDKAAYSHLCSDIKELRDHSFH